MRKFYFFPFILFVTTSILFAVTPGQWDNFQDHTKQGWQVGKTTDPNQPVVITDGGPAGVGDDYLLLTSSQTGGAGTKLVVYNTKQWKGDYTSAGIKYISMNLKNFGTTDLKVRIVLEGSGGNFWSKTPVSIPAGSNWIVAKFSVEDTALTGGNNISTTLSNVSEVRILHSKNGGYRGDIITAQLGIDNITASEQPLPVELVSFSSLTEGNKVNLLWTTATETNNFGFEIQRKVSKDGNWVARGFIKGIGTSSEKHSYSFIEQGVPEGNYYYRLKQVDYSGVFSYSDVIEVNVSVLQFNLSQNYPNPFNPVTVIKYSLPQTEYVTLKVYNAVGEEIATLVNKVNEAGIHQVEFDASQLSSGVYFYKISVSALPGPDGLAGSFVQVKKMILMK